MKEESLGLTVKKSEDISEWYTQVIQKAELVEYTDVSGCYVLRPRAYSIWETIQCDVDRKLKEKGIKNAYFPLFIPEHLLQKEAAHVKGFTPEVAWVTETGNSKLQERLAVRPTSETIIYPCYAKWIRSYRDLPLRLNQWANIVRWEFKHPFPFLRSREFLWQEGHSAFATQKEADNEVLDILQLYKQMFEDLCAVPVIVGRKSEREKFAGALYTLSLETFLPSGKGIQCATSHSLGQNFSKVFDVTFLDEKGERNFVWLNSWGLTTRSIGILLLMHGDDKGLIIPPKIAPQQVVIVPIFTNDSMSKVLKSVKDLQTKLKGYSVFIDDREQYSPGWKFNEWELKGVPVRLEVGPKELENKTVVLVRRDTGKKEVVAVSQVVSRLSIVLDDIQKALFEKAKKFLRSSERFVKNFREFEKALEEGMLVKTYWCLAPSCEENIKDKTGAKSLNIPLEQKAVKEKCFACGQNAEQYAYFARAY